MSAERSLEAVDSFIPGVDPAQLYIRPLLNGPLRPATRQECESHEQRCVPLSGGALEEDFRSAPENEANCVRVQSLLGIDGMRRSTPITDGVKLPVINALYGAITVNKEIDLEQA